MLSAELLEASEPLIEHVQRGAVAQTDAFIDNCLDSSGDTAFDVMQKIKG